MKKVISIFLALCLSWSVFAKGEVFSTLDGTKLSYENIVFSPKTILFVWTTWCPHCRKELERLTQKCIFFKGIEIFFINIGENKSTVQKFADAKNFGSCIRSKIILDTNSFFLRKFSIIGVPTFLFFKNSQLRYKSYFLDEELLKDVFEDE